MARHRSPGDRGTYPVPTATVSGRHSQDGGARHSVSELLRTASSVAVLDRDEQTPAPDVPAPRDGAGIVRLPAPRMPAIELVWPQRRARTDHEQLDGGPSTAELEALFTDAPPEGPAPAGVAETEPQPRPQRRGHRLGTVAVALAGGAMSLVAATVPVDALAGGYGTAALATDTSDAADSADSSAADGDGPADVLPPVVDGSKIAASIAEAHQQVTDQVQAAEAGLEAARKKAADEKAAADKAAAEKAAAVTAQRNCGVSEKGLGPVKPFVRTAAQLLGCRYGKPTMYGVAGRGGVSDHPGGKAVDFMVDRGTGDALAACALRNKAALGINYVIWRQRINFGQGWQGMEDRGGVTANHFDHVHVSFANGAKGESLQGCG